MDDLLQWLIAQIDEDERIAREASGGTVVGVPGNWQPAPAGDEWEALAGDIAEELLVALRPGLPRPPDVMSGMWGAIASNEPDSDPGAGSAMPALVHAARHDPARVLREVEAKRSIIEQHERYAAERRRMMGGWDPQSDDSPILAALAAVYADRPGYREEWRP
ncbi:DUF6221 family protein [Streptomyces stelliscabiei]|uniref:DUF6221 family protein n=1 Tax=Streptomyces stelliscabiei TaxID=146820 RepID=UPI0029A1DB01|nr:DUF6221 family protein [Streptomyces stelliscabiei]MDX2667408.1 DUF6221 family protein [Streptomyces stelliscabiei]MDX2785947.1 DUF6221 family protein [Streptomyces stelliscabiei]